MISRSLRCLNSVLSGRSQIECLATAWARPLCSSSERETLPFDVCIVGAGPAGLSAAIRLKQLAKEGDREVSVAVLEKGSDVGSHILSGNVLDPKALNELFPKVDPDDDDHAWKALGAPVKTRARWDRFSILSQYSRWWFPVPSTMRNGGTYIVSLSELCRWLGKQAEEAGVEILTSCAASDVVMDSHGSVLGVLTKDMGIAKDGSRKDSYMPGAKVTARVTMFAEGCRGSLSEQLISKLNLREEVGAEHQTYALGMKEVWQVDSNKHKEGLVEHLVGYPLDSWTYGGAFIYHMEDKKVSLGFVVALDYWNTYLNPYQEFQKFKSHSYVRRLLEGGECLEYGARALNEGGIQSVPKVNFGGGCLLGCSAGLMNVPRIKGTHTAMKSGMLAADAAFREIVLGGEDSTAPLHMNGYARQLEGSWVHHELTQVKNVRPGFKWGFWMGMLNAGLETYVYAWLFGGPMWTVPANVPDREATKPADSCKRIDYPPPDGEVTFDMATSLYRSGTNHEHDQPAHLKLKSPGALQTVNVNIYDRPETRYCPAGVYEYGTDEVTGRPQLQINAQNCLHCKACDIKDPTHNIVWTVPEGGGGPNYTGT